MSNCGYCKRNSWRNSWVLVPVTVSSRGKELKSWAHKTCIPKWRKIADVRVREDVTNLLELNAAREAKQWLDVTLPQQTREADRRRNERNRVNKKRYCVDCGREIYWKESTRCNSCHTLYQHQTFRVSNDMNGERNE